MIVFRNCDPRYPFLWEEETQPPGRWHGQGEGPVQYFADTPTGAWAEFLRHEEIRDPAELAGVRRALWAVQLADPPQSAPDLPEGLLRGDPGSYAACQEEARRLRSRGTAGLLAPSAALKKGGAGGWQVEGGLRQGEPREGAVLVLFGPQPRLTGWPVVTRGAPPREILERVHHFGDSGP